jgi:cell wall-associated NlpC family hydrolase
MSWVGRYTYAEMDCERLVVDANQLRGVEIPGLYRGIFKGMFWTVDTPEPWDIVPISNHVLGVVTHAALYLGNGMVIQSFEDSGPVIIPLTREPWWSRIARYQGDPERRGYLRLRSKHLPV